MHPNLELIQEQLIPFIKHTKVAQILEGLKRLMKADAEQFYQGCRNRFERERAKERLSDRVDRVRMGLNRLLSSSNSDVLLEEALYQALLQLAEYKPLNEEDPIYLIEIQEGDKGFTSEGRQWSLSALVEWHNGREVRRGAGESADNKWLLNPVTNRAFPPRDAEHLFELIDRYGLHVQSVHFMHEINFIMKGREYESLDLPHRLVVVDYSNEIRRFMLIYGLTFYSIQKLRVEELVCLCERYDVIESLLNRRVFSLRTMLELEANVRVALLQNFIYLIDVLTQEGSLPGELASDDLSNLINCLNFYSENQCSPQEILAMPRKNRQILFEQIDRFTQLLRLNIPSLPLLKLALLDFKMVLDSADKIEFLIETGRLSAAGCLLLASDRQAYAQLTENLVDYLSSLNVQEQEAKRLGQPPIIRVSLSPYGLFVLAEPEQNKQMVFPRKKEGLMSREPWRY